MKTLLCSKVPMQVPTKFHFFPVPIDIHVKSSNSTIQQLSHTLLTLEVNKQLRKIAIERLVKEIASCEQ